MRMYVNCLFLLKAKSQDANTMNVFTNLTTSRGFLIYMNYLKTFISKIRLYFKTTNSKFCFNGTEYKGVDDDSWYGGANYKAENHIYSEAGCKGDGDSEHSLQSDGQQQDETSTVPCAERREGVDMI